MAITNECRKFESHRQCDVVQNRFYTGNSGVPTLLNNCSHDVKPLIKQMNSAYVNAICVAFLEQVFDMQHSTLNIKMIRNSLLRVHTAYTRPSSAIRAVVLTYEMWLANNKSANQSAHPRSLISAFIIHIL